MHRALKKGKKLKKAEKFVKAAKFFRVDFRTSAIIVSALLYWVRKFTPHVIHESWR